MFLFLNSSHVFPMTNFFRRLKAAWFYMRTVPYVVLPNNYWTDADARAWSNFLTSDTGVKLRHMRWNRVFMSAQQAIVEQVDSRYKCGVAFGVKAMVAEEDALLSISLPEQETIS